MISVNATTGLLDTIAAAGANPDQILSTLGLERSVLANPDGCLRGSFAVTPIAVPEPETYAMLLAGLGMLGLSARRRKSQSSENRNNRHAY